MDWHPFKWKKQCANYNNNFMLLFFYFTLVLLAPISGRIRIWNDGFKGGSYK